MKILKTLVGILLPISILVSCQKEFAPDLGNTPTPNIPEGPDYFPTTANSFWSYTLDVTGDTVQFTSTANNTTINNNSYRPFKVTSGNETDSLYYRKENGTYHEYGDVDFLGALDSVGEYIDYIFLKDNVAINSTWESGEINAAYNSAQGKAKTKFTITGKDIKHTINNVQVDSIILVQRDVMFKPNTGTNPTFSTINSINCYYAKNKGLLLVEGTLPPPLPPIPFKFEATRYRVY